MSPEEIRARRLALGWSQARLATAAGTSQQTIDRLERGEVRHARALPAVIAILSPSAPERSGAALAAGAYAAPAAPPVAGAYDRAPDGPPRSASLRMVYGGIPQGEGWLRLTAAVEVLPPPPMLAPVEEAYGVALEGDVAPFRRGDVLWLHPLLRPRPGGPGLIFEAPTPPSAGARGRLALSAQGPGDLQAAAHRVVAVYFRGGTDF